MIGTINSVDVHAFYGLTLTKVELGEYILKLYFGDNNRIDIEEYWEYIDKDAKLIDRYYSSKYRKSFLLPQLVGHKLVTSNTELSHVALVFDNHEGLLIPISESIHNADLFTCYANRIANPTAYFWYGVFDDK